MIEFIESTHTYLVNGEIVPSATTILGKTIFKDKYSSIPQIVLERAAQFGTNVHKAIELGFGAYLTDKEYQVYDKYLNLVESENIAPLEHEIIIHYNMDYAGTLDMIGTVNGVRSLLDIKTTSKLDLEYLSWQLSMYDLAYGETFEKLYAIWIPKVGKAKLVEIQRKTPQEIEWLIKKYKEIENERID
jgi:hypothetical protein